MPNSTRQKFLHAVVLHKAMVFPIKIKQDPVLDKMQRYRKIVYPFIIQKIPAFRSYQYIFHQRINIRHCQGCILKLWCLAKHLLQFFRNGKRLFIFREKHCRFFPSLPEWLPPGPFLPRSLLPEPAPGFSLPDREILPSFRLPRFPVLPAAGIDAAASVFHISSQTNGYGPFPLL